jgi:hypothetical protein
VILRGGGKDRRGEKEGYEHEALHLSGTKIHSCKKFAKHAGHFSDGFPDLRKIGIAPVENAVKYFSTICVTADKISALSFEFFGIKV